MPPKSQRNPLLAEKGKGDVVGEFPLQGGDGLIAFNNVGGKTTISRLYAMSPLKFITPTPNTNSASKGAAWVYVIGFGGGLVAGDLLRVRCSLSDNTTAVVTTQASTKVFQTRHGAWCRQLLSATVADGALLALLVDPVVPYANSRFRQSWDFEHYESCNKVFVGDRLVLQDSQKLSNLEGCSLAPVRRRMRPFEVFATVVLAGPRTEKVRKEVLEDVRGRQSEVVPGTAGGFVGVGGKRSRHPGEGEEAERDGLICSAGELPGGGGVILRIAGLGYEEVETALRERLKSLEDECGSEIWRRKYSLH